ALTQPSLHDALPILVQARGLAGSGGPQHQDMPARDGVGQGGLAQAKRHERGILLLFLLDGLVKKENPALVPLRLGEASLPDSVSDRKSTRLNSSHVS